MEKMEPTPECGFKPYRFKLNPLEKRFVEQWIEILSRNPNFIFYLLNDDNKPNHVPDEDIKIANTIIQWFGTPVGITFLRDVLEVENPCEKCIVKACCRGRKKFECPENKMWLATQEVKGRKQ